jgi:hypothetical protein
MAQPCGKVCDIPAGIGHLLRISPIICLLDVLIFIARTIVYTVTTGSFLAANRKILIQRYTADDDDSGVFKDFRENTYTRWVIFAFSVPQIVKLFAFQGVLITQICAAIFLGSFVIIELCVVLPKAYTTLEAPEVNKYNMGNSDFDSLSYWTVAAGIFFILYAGIWATLCLLWASVTFMAVFPRGSATARRVVSMLSWYFWSSHLVAALLYYKYVYDPRGTVKPVWTEQLG